MGHPSARARMAPAMMATRMSVRMGVTTPSSATPGRGRGCEHGGAMRRRVLCRASWRAAQPVTEPVGPQPRPVTERQSPEFAAAHGSAFRWEYEQAWSTGEKLQKAGFIRCDVDAAPETLAADGENAGGGRRRVDAGRGLLEVHRSDIVDNNESECLGDGHPVGFVNTWWADTWFRRVGCESASGTYDECNGCKCKGSHGVFP